MLKWWAVKTAFLATLASWGHHAQPPTKVHKKHHKKKHRRSLLWHFIERNVTCYHEGSQTSDGGPVFVGEVASNELPLETHIRLSHPVFGRHEFTVKDHIGYGSRLDIYGPSESACNTFGRQSLSYAIVG